MSPRRSSRARITQVAPSTTTSSASHPSSTSSVRADRNARSHNKHSSPHKSGTPQSGLSSESGDRAHTSEPPPSRRSKRGQEIGTEEDRVAKIDTLELEGEEDEITRCLCGQQDYPGPPETRHARTSHVSLDTTNDEAGGLFIQCDVCKVWQHGGCVGIMDEVSCPENYFCESCKPELHEILATKTGQKYSLYLPTNGKTAPKSQRKASTSKEGDIRAKEKEREKEKAARADALAKRRLTMNSRIAYDEEEMLKRALEESKRDGDLVVEHGTRKTKRGRDESEETKTDNKRQRTASDLSSSPSQAQSPAADSDVDANNKQRLRNATARSHRVREVRDRDGLKERERAEAASKRKGRLDRRRADDSDLPEEEPNLVRPSTAPSDIEPRSSQPPGTPYLEPSAGKSNKKVPIKGKSNRGKNQYTRDATASSLDIDSIPLNGDSRSRRGGDEASPARNGRSGDNTDGGGSGKDAGSGGSPHHNTKSGGTKEVSGKSKVKQLNPHKTSMAEMRRKVHAMMAYVGQAQTAMMEKQTFSLALRAAFDQSAKGLGKETDEPAKASDSASKTGANGVVKSDLGADANRTSDMLLKKSVDDFGALTSQEMAALLTSRMELWQQEFGKLGER